MILDCWYCWTAWAGRHGQVVLWVALYLFTLYEIEIEMVDIRYSTVCRPTVVQPIGGLSHITF